jgi:hydrogenase maturation protease
MTTQSPDRPRILIAGVGNIFLGDDAFGVEVVQRLAQRPLPEAVRVVDFGIRGLDLAYALLDGYEAVILVDAAPHGGRPGTLYVLEPETGSSAPGSGEAPLIETHNLDPARVLSLVAALGGTLPRLLVVGCEPDMGAAEDDITAGLSPPVRAAVDEAVPLVESLLARLADEGIEKSIPAKEVHPCPT